MVKYNPVRHGFRYPHAVGSRRLEPRVRARRPRRVSLHKGHLPFDVPRPALDDAAVRRIRYGGRLQPPLPLPARSGGQRPERGVRPADADRLRLRPCARRGRDRTRRRGDRLDRGHGGAVRRHSAGPRFHVDDDQTPPPPYCWRCTWRWPGGKAWTRASWRAPCRTTSSRSTRRAARTSIPRAPRCGLQSTCSATATPSCPAGTPSRSAAITSGRRAPRRPRRLRSRSRTRWCTSSRPSTPAST